MKNKKEPSERQKHERSEHQTDNLAKLWKDYLFFLELIAKIGCAVSKTKI